jgi:hypothetical protein
MFCNSCGVAFTDGEAVCRECGHALRQEPHISDIASGGVANCDICGAMNLDEANFCRSCGKKLKLAILQEVSSMSLAGVAPSAPQAVFPSHPLDYVINTEAQIADNYENEATQDLIPAKHESLLEKLDRMEKELETRANEVLPETEQEGPDDLDKHEETLKNIAYTLDSLISDLLEAEVREYAFPDFIHPDETGFPTKDAPKAPPHQQPEAKTGRNIQEILVIGALIAAIFLVGLSFGLWGSYYFGLQ